MRSDRTRRRADFPRRSYTVTIASQAREEFDVGPHLACGPQAYHSHLLALPEISLDHGAIIYEKETEEKSAPPLFCFAKRWRLLFFCVRLSPPAAPSMTLINSCRSACSLTLSSCVAPSPDANDAILRRKRLPRRRSNSARGDDRIIGIRHRSWSIAKGIVRRRPRNALEVERHRTKARRAMARRASRFYSR